VCVAQSCELEQMRHRPYCVMRKQMQQQQLQISPRIGFVGAAASLKAWPGAWRQSGQRVVAAASRAGVGRGSWREDRRLPGGCNPQESSIAATWFFLPLPDHAIAGCASLLWRKDWPRSTAAGQPSWTRWRALRGRRAHRRISPLAAFADRRWALPTAGLHIAIESRGRRCCRSWSGWGRRCACRRTPARLPCRAITRLRITPRASSSLLNNVELWQSFGIEREYTDTRAAAAAAGTGPRRSLGLAQGLAGTYSRGDIGPLESTAELAARRPGCAHLTANSALRRLPLGLERGAYDEPPPSDGVLLRRRIAGLAARAGWNSLVEALPCCPRPAERRRPAAGEGVGAHSGSLRAQRFVANLESGAAGTGRNPPNEAGRRP